MMEKEYNKAKVAYQKFNLDTEYGKIDKVLEYTKKRIEANENEIREIIRINNEEESYERIIEAIREEVNTKTEYKAQVILKKREDNFVSSIYKTSVGIVGVECFNTIESIKYMLRGIKNKDAIILSDIEYKEKDVKALILEIIKEALVKFDIDENLITRLPYEEVDYTKCDKVICTYNNKNERKKEEINSVYIYIEDESLKSAAYNDYEYQKNNQKDIEILYGDIDEVIDRINEKEAIGAVIYTKDSKVAYKFINLVRAKNVFANTSIDYMENVDSCDNKLLMNKKIMYELTKKL